MKNPVIESNVSTPYAILHTGWVINGVNTTFPLTYVPDPHNTDPSINGMLVPFNVSGSSIILSVAPEPGDTVTVIYWAIANSILSPYVYPNFIRGIGFTVNRAPEFSTIVHSSPGFYESSISQAPNPRWHYELTYNYLKDNPLDIQIGVGYPDFQVLQAFFLAQYGRGKDWLFDDDQSPDNYVGPGLTDSYPNLDAQLQLVQDSNTSLWYTPIQRPWVGGMYNEDVSDLNGAISLYANGTLKSLGSDYVMGGPGLAIPGFSFSGLYAQWNSEPQIPITAGFYFYRRCRFDMDKWEMDKFMQWLWSAGGDQGFGGESVKFVTKFKYKLS